MCVYLENIELNEIYFSEEIPYENVQNNISELLDFKIFWGMSHTLIAAHAFSDHRSCLIFDKSLAMALFINIH